MKKVSSKKLDAFTSQAIPQDRQKQIKGGNEDAEIIILEDTVDG